jgi:glycosyltransferase involved in cell wall biosynthesis
LAAICFVVPGDPATRTGGYLYDARIVNGLRRQGWQVVLHALADSFPHPNAQALAAAEQLFAAFPAGTLVVVDGLALAGMPRLLASQAGRLRLVALIHHPLAAETGLHPAEQEQLFQAERDALATVDRVIVTSPSTARALADYGVAAEHIGVVTPGTDPAPLAAGSGSTGVRLLCVATLTPRKGHAILFDALATLPELDWQLQCVGSFSRSPATVARLRTQLTELALESRVQLIDEVAALQLAAYYHRADLFVLPSYYEGYGMALAEAIARGLPLVSTTAGAIPDTAPEDAAVLVPPGDSAALAAALRGVLSDAEWREALAAGARAARRRLVDWPTACAGFAAQLQRVS